MSIVESDDEFVDVGIDGDVILRLYSYIGGFMILGEYDDDDDYGDDGSGVYEEFGVIKDVFNIIV